MTEENKELITIDMLREKLIQLVKDNPDLKKPENSWKVLSEHLCYMTSNYIKLTLEAQKQADKICDVIVDHMEKIVFELPDSVETRKLKRLVKGAKGKRLLVENYIGALERPIDSPSKFQIKNKEFFDKYVQIVMDLLQDILGHTFRGPVAFSQIALLGVCIDELLVAFHLSQRSYVQQAFSHIRTIQEALDLIELFRIKPEEVELWISEKDWHEIWKGLQPGKVREKLGSDEIFGKIYHLFSSLGSHPTFEMMRMRCRKSIKCSEQEKPLFSVFIGGTPNIKEAIFAPIFILLSIFRILGAVIINFGHLLNIEEVQSVLTAICNDFTDFLDETIFQPMGTDEDKLSLEQMKKEMQDSLNNFANNFIKKQ